jgi:hypothetical protein
MRRQLASPNQTQTDQLYRLPAAGYSAYSQLLSILHPQEYLEKSVNMFSFYFLSSLKQWIRLRHKSGTYFNTITLTINIHLD